MLYPALTGIRIGCVQYLNARPLIWDAPEGVCFDHPSGLARDMAKGGLDAALVPVFEALGDRTYRLVDGVAIASDGPVYSVFLAYRGDLARIRTIALDPASLTSVHLLQVLLAEFHGLRPACIDAKRTAHEAEAHLLIGNQAIEYRAAASGSIRFMDLGEEWTRRTGLPFVYALWLLRHDLPGIPAVADDFRALKAEGVARIEEIVEVERTGTVEFRRRYLTEHIRFDLGPREKAGLNRFRALLAAHGFISAALKPLDFV